MADLHAYYYENDNKGIFRWNGGEGTVLGTQCKAELQRYQVVAVPCAVVRWSFFD